MGESVKNFDFEYKPVHDPNDLWVAAFALRDVVRYCREHQVQLPARLDAVSRDALNKLMPEWERA